MTTLAALGSRLRSRGLSSRLLATWIGSDRLSALPGLLPRVAGASITPASALLALFVAGDDVPADRVPELDELVRHELVEIVDGRVHARVSILPLGAALLVCDRLDTSDGLDIVCWPDDSSYHLALALPPGRRPTWLDLGCGSAFAALLRPELANTIVASDLNERAVRYARLGCELSGLGHVAIAAADLGEGLPAELRGGCALVSCNAPIPDAAGSSIHARWRLADPSFVARMLEQARSLVAPHGMVVVHAALDALDPIAAELPGERVIVAYTPEGVRGFAVAWWQPDGEAQLVRARRPLTQQRPHLEHEDRLAAVAGALSPL